MPVYRYECESCGHEFRVLQEMGSDEPMTCPKCQARNARRLLSRVAVQFKGSGYYKTDRASKRSKAGTKDTSAGDSSDGDSGASSEPTPETSSSDSE